MHRWATIATVLTATLLAMILLQGCATLSRQDCQSTDWRALGYRHGAGGIHYSELQKYRSACSEYDIVPDESAYQSGWQEGIRRFCSQDNGFELGSVGKPLSSVCPLELAEAFRHGWEQGIRSYCSEEQGYRLGAAGQNFNNICPVNSQAAFRSGWERGIRSYCSPQNGLSRGLSGDAEPLFCPDDLRYAFHDRYRLGRELRDIRQRHERDEERLARLDRELSMPASKHRDSLLRELRQARHQELESHSKMTALQACVEGKWRETGFRDGESGVPGRPHQIMNLCMSYGITPSIKGYAEGWHEGIHYYCNYEHGLYMGRANLSDEGMCAGSGYWRFRDGFEHGRSLYLKETRSFREHVGKDPGVKGMAIDPASIKVKFPVGGAPGKEGPSSGGHGKPERPDSGLEPERDKSGEGIHDNRDKLKHPMPDSAQKQKSDNENNPAKIKKENDHQGKE